MSLLAACAGSGRRGPARLAEFDFVYGSATHIPPSEGVLRTRASPEKTLAVVRDELMRASAREMTLAEARGLSFGEEADRKWQERKRVAQEEWSAYARRDRTALEAIDRPPGLREGPAEEAGLPAVRLSARVWERDAIFEYETVTTTERRYRNSNRVDRRTDTKTRVTSDPMASEISFLVWSGPDAVTNVYVTATPIIKDMRESENPSIALQWLPFAKGYDEAELVRTYQKILRRRLPPAL